MDSETLCQQFLHATRDIAALARAIGEESWAEEFFDRAAKALENPQTPCKTRLRAAYRHTRVFGGMGSWNDNPLFSADEKGLSGTYERCSTALYQAREATRRHLLFTAIK